MSDPTLSPTHPVLSKEVLLTTCRDYNKFRSRDDVVEKMLRKGFMEKGLHHVDVAWQNVGVYHDNDSHIRAVVFIMQKVDFVENQEEDCIQSAVMSHFQKLMD